MIKEILSLLKEHGKIYIAVSNHSEYFELINALRSVGITWYSGPVEDTEYVPEVIEKNEPLDNFALCVIQGKRRVVLTCCPDLRGRAPIISWISTEVFEWDFQKLLESI